jgi:hypothetical protein
MGIGLVLRQRLCISIDATGQLVVDLQKLVTLRFDTDAFENPTRSHFDKGELGWCFGRGCASASALWDN